MKVLGIDVDSIADRCAEKISKHKHEMSNPEIEESLKEIAYHLDRLATLLEQTQVSSRKTPR